MFLRRCSLLPRPTADRDRPSYGLSNEVVADAKITLINNGTNIQHVAATNGTGTYYFRLKLLAGTYRIEVEKAGFKSVIKPGIVLHVQDALEINFEMAVGSLTETVTVEAGTPTVELTTATISSVVDSTLPFASFL